jgi:type I restriction enzyme R subunit
MAAFVTDGLRACQIDAVSALEISMAQNRPRALVQMATGAGKTFTACTLSYRLLAHAGFKRILFLADRANLVRQTRDEYRNRPFVLRNLQRPKARRGRPR